MSDDVTRDSFIALQWDICPSLHAMNDFAGGPGGEGFSRSHTYNAECYALRPGGSGRCHRKGKCLIARKLNGKAP